MADTDGLLDQRLRMLFGLLDGEGFFLGYARLLALGEGEGLFLTPVRGEVARVVPTRILWSIPAPPG